MVWLERRSFENAVSIMRQREESSLLRRHRLTQNDTESSDEDDDEDAPAANKRQHTAKTRLRRATALKGTSQQPLSLRMC